MCTAITYKTDANYFGRNFDYDISYSEKVVITPRNFKFKFRKEGTLKTHYAFIGVAAVIENYPLYYDATNEKGLSVAGLNFPKNAFYNDFIEGKINISPFELIPWLLGSFATVEEARESLENLNLVNINFNEQLPLSPLHWMISDKDESIVVESVSQFFHILGSVEQQNGLCDLGNGKYEKTIYSSCCNIDEGIYYYKTYNNSQINAVDMKKENLDGSNLYIYPLINEQNINLVN